MKENEKKTYNKNLELYSLILKGKIKGKTEILECIRLLEYFEDYEKCEHLINVIKEIDNSTT